MCVPSKTLLEMDKKIVQNNSQCVSNSVSFEYAAQGTAAVLNVSSCLYIYSHQYLFT